MSPTARALGDEERTEGEKSDGRTLIVGREIRLAGEITSCERLIVEGRVEADLSDCRELVISAPGVVKGCATVKNAAISGLFDGELTVLGHLLVKNGGKVKGRLIYHEIEVERGGKILGEMTEGDSVPAQSHMSSEAQKETTAEDDMTVEADPA